MTLDRWLAIIGLILACIGIGLAVWFYKRSVKKRGPTFVKNPQTLTLVREGLAKWGPFSLRYDGREVGAKSIAVIQIYFWNSGSMEITALDVRKPYYIRIPDAVILSYKTVKTNRDVIHAEINNVDEAANELSLSFDLLEPGDGAAFEILYEGPPNAPVEFGGVCVGASKPIVLPSDPSYFTTMPARFAWLPQLAILLTFLCLLGGAVYGCIWVLKHFFSERVVAVAFLCRAAATGRGQICADRPTRLTHHLGLSAFVA